MSEPQYGAPFKERPQAGCMLHLLSTFAGLLMGMFFLGAGGGVLGIESGPGRVLLFAAGIAAGWIGVRTWAAERSTAVVYRCQHCGARTDPAFPICSSCRRVKHPA